MSTVVGDNIRRYRKIRGITQAQLAVELGKNKRTISNWEVGLRDPGSDNVRKLASALGVSPSDIIGPTGSYLDNDYVYIVNTPEMIPDIKIGDVLRYKKHSVYQSGDIVVLRLPGGRVICRKYIVVKSVVYLSAFSPETPPIIYDDRIMEILGRVYKLERNFTGLS